ncbi:MAG: RnfABCDGE type electron transport complex subunit D, partial [Treponema sp.]|nr:RnfABCDGE type electron transport complex subunit D [Treponema sp.]
MAETKKQPPMEPVLLSSSPHIASPASTRSIMSLVLIAIAPAAAFGVVLYGLPALLTILVSMAAAALAESLFRRITGQDIRAADLSAAVTGLLLALIVPPSTPLWMTALGSAFAVVVAKEFFGGLGANVFNPALTGRAFLIMSFPAALTAWHRPAGFVTTLADAVSGPTPLGIIRRGVLADVTADFAAAGPASDYWSVMKTLFIGNYSGCIGESSALLILAGGIFLLANKIIDWRAPAAMILTAAAASFALGRDPLFSVLSGGLL